MAPPAKYCHAGDVAFVPGGTSYGRWADQPCQVWVIHHRETGLSSQVLRLHDQEVNVVSGLVAFTCDQTAVRSVLLGLSQQWPDAIRFDMARPLMQAAWRWLEWPCGEALDSRALRGGSPAVTTALDLVARHHTRQDYGVAQIALAVGMHPSSLTRAVRQQTGRTLIAHFNQARVLTAPRLLKDPRHAVEEVAHESGFSSRSHFTRTFTRLTGVHPSKFRRLGHLESDSMP